ncbi:MAG: phage holin family protein [Stellaceae bacterium]
MSRPEGFAPGGFAPGGFAPGGFAPGPDGDTYETRPPRSIAALFADLANHIGTLLRLELALFRAELTEKLRRLRLGLVTLMVGLFLALSGWLALIAAAIIALATVVRPWLAALIIGAAAMTVAGLLLYLAKRWLAPASLVPRRTIGALGESEAWVEESVP